MRVRDASLAVNMNHESADQIYMVYTPFNIKLSTEANDNFEGNNSIWTRRVQQNQG
jgi:hypothetical protein